MALYTVNTGMATAAADLNQVINLLSGATPLLQASMTVANRVQAQLTGATATSGLVGSTSNGPPTSGTFVLGDLVVDTGYTCLWICTTAGTPGTWMRLGGAAWASQLFNLGGLFQGLATRSGRTGFDVLVMQSTDDVAYYDQITFPGISATNAGFTIPVAGTYLFYGQMLAGGPTAATDLGVMILKNGTPYQFGTQVASYAAAQHIVTAQVTCAVNDVIQLGAYAEGPYSITVTGNGTGAFLAAIFLAN